MANVLKVTTLPSTTYNNTLKGSPQINQDPNIKNQVDLNRVVRQDAKENQQGFNQQGLLHYESNYNKFLENIQKSLPLSNILSELIGSDFSSIVENPAASASMMADLKQLLEMIQLEEGEVLDFVKNQVSSSIGFKSAFFDMLRDLMNHSNSVEFRSDILRFAKKFNDMASGQRLISEIAKHLTDIARSIPRSDSQALSQMIDALNLDAAKGETSANLALLKNEVLPLLSKYIVHSNDFGRVRDLLSLLSLSIARYESGSKEDVMAAMKTLSMYSSFRERIGQLDDEGIGYILDRLLSDKIEKSNALSDQLSNIVDKGLRGQAGYENKAIFENMARSILVNQSVYMPLIHSLIPFELQGKLLVSEMWIDPDDGNHSAKGESERITRVYLRFEISDLGNFDMVMNLQDKKVDLQLLCPSQMERDFSEIKNGIRQIVESNSLVNSHIYVEKNEGKLTLSEVFPKIKEGRNNINVTI